MSVMLCNTTNNVCVTGKGLYRYIELIEEYKDEDGKLQPKLTKLNAINLKGLPVSENYSCHCWIKDTARLIVCT